MKKIYQTPQVEKVIYNSDIMESEITPDSVGVSGSVTGEEDTDWDFGGTGTGPVNSKSNGRGFWDDEE